MNGGYSVRATAILFALWLALAGCEAPKLSPNTANSAKSKSQQSLMRGARLRQVENGRLEVDFNAEEAWQDARGVVHARGVRVVYHPPEGARAILMAKEAKYDVARRRLEAVGDVRVKSEGRILETHRLVWDGKKGKVSTDGAVKVTQGKNILTGRGLDADPSLERIVLREDVKITARDASSFKPLVDALEEK
jgi:LPS export ABC transporter protein LptC